MQGGKQFCRFDGEKLERKIGDGKVGGGGVVRGGLKCKPSGTRQLLSTAREQRGTTKQ